MIDKNISKSVKFSFLDFPSRLDYEAHFMEKGLIQSTDELWNNQLFVKAIHRHWHGEGQNGCIFALLAARKADELGWQSFVMPHSINVIETEEFKSQTTAIIQDAIDNKDCEIISLLYSNITSEIDLVRLIKSLMSFEIVQTVENRVIDNSAIISLRIPIDNNNTLSWLMSFGPYSFYPNTRRAPITEIAIRVKPKPIKQFHKLSKDTDAAHLADLPLDYSDQVMERTWENTYRRTRIILGGEPTLHSAAKTTFTLPQEIWE